MGMRRTTSLRRIDFALLSLLAVACVLPLLPGSAFAQRSEIHFVNEASEPIVIKLRGPSVRQIELAASTRETLNAVGAGSYDYIVRAGSAPNFQYHRGRQFVIEETASMATSLTIRISIRTVVGAVPEQSNEAALAGEFAASGEPNTAVEPTMAKLGYEDEPVDAPVAPPVPAPLAGVLPLGGGAWRLNAMQIQTVNSLPMPPPRPNVVSVLPAGEGFVFVKILAQIVPVQSAQGALETSIYLHTRGERRNTLIGLSGIGSGPSCDSVVLLGRSTPSSTTQATYSLRQPVPGLPAILTPGSGPLCLVFAVPVKLLNAPMQLRFGAASTALDIPKP
jgi:hypothetical protein